ncbi:hypothetical protein [Nostoc sp.]
MQRIVLLFRLRSPILLFTLIYAIPQINTKNTNDLGVILCPTFPVRHVY